MGEPLRLSLNSPTESYIYVGHEPLVKIGRSHNCEFSVPKEDLSREHCLFEVSKHGFFITDLGSKNGVCIDRKRIIANSRTAVSHESHILLANIYTLKVNPPELISKTISDFQRSRDSLTTTFEFSPEEKTSPFAQIKTILKGHEGPNEKIEIIKMVVGFLVILGFVLYQVLGR